MSGFSIGSIRFEKGNELESELPHASWCKWYALSSPLNYGAVASLSFEIFASFTSSEVAKRFHVASEHFFACCTIQFSMHEAAHLSDENRGKYLVASAFRVVYLVQYVVYTFFNRKPRWLAYTNALLNIGTVASELMTLKEKVPKWYNDRQVDLENEKASRFAKDFFATHVHCLALQVITSLFNVAYGAYHASHPMVRFGVGKAPFLVTAASIGIDGM